MPLYEYQCEACQQITERIQKFSDPPLEVCPACGGRLKKLLSSPAFQFKGSGWYVTDYARKGKSEKAERPEKSEGSEKAEKSGKAEKSESSAKSEKPAKSDTSSTTKSE